MLAERPILTHPSLEVRPQRDWGVVLHLQSYYWLQEGVAYGVGLAFVELGFWAMPTELGGRCLAWGEALLNDALQASCCCTALAVARSHWTEDPASGWVWTPSHWRHQRPDLSQPPTWGTLGSALLHGLVVLLWIWQGSRPVPELEQRIPIMLLELPPEPELAADPVAEPVQESEPEPAAPLPPAPVAEPDPLPPPAVPASQPEPLPEPLPPPPEPDPLPLANLGLQTPSPTPTSTPTPTPTFTPTPPPTPEPTPPPTPVPTATPPLTPTSTPVPTPAAMAQQPSSPAVMPASPAPAGTPVPRLTPLLQGIQSRQRDGVLSSGPSGASSSAATSPSPQAASTSTPLGAPAGTPASTSPPSPPPVAANPQPDTLAQPIPGRNAPPQYPPQARRLNQQGQVMLRAKVDPQGQVQQVEILSSSGFPALDSAAQQAVQQWQFSPALKNNVPIESWVTVPIQFALN
ncbi:MAG: energy transducer TonB [Cyanobacteriota bacterium]